MKKNFYLNAVLGSLFLPTVYLLFIYKMTLPGLLDMVINLGDSLKHIMDLWPHVLPITGLFILNFVLILLFTDFSDYISPLYTLNVIYDTESINNLQNEINSYYSKDKGKIHEYKAENIIELLTLIDEKLATYIDDIKPGELIFRDPDIRQQILSGCELPLALKKASTFWHKYYIQKSESIFESHFSKDKPEKRVSFQSYIKFRSSPDLNKIMFVLNLFEGIRNRGKYLVVPLYDQLVIEDINSKGGGHISAEFYCFIPFVFFPHVAIEKVLFCLKKNDEYYPMAVGMLKPKLD